jgi:transposase
VKPYLKGQKNDARDAAAICEVISRPEMRFDPQKSIAQQDLQALYRIRSRLIGSRPSSAIRSGDCSPHYSAAPSESGSKTAA